MSNEEGYTLPGETPQTTEEETAPEVEVKEETPVEAPEVKEEVAEEKPRKSNIDRYSDNLEQRPLSWNIESGSEPPFDYGHRTTKMTVENLDFNLEELFPKRKWRENDYIISLPTGNGPSINEAYEKNPNPLLRGDEKAMEEATPDDLVWGFQISQSTQLLFENDQFRWTRLDNKARWKEGIELPTGKVRGFRSPPNTVLSGQRSEKNALSLAKSLLNLSRKKDLFLTHSGFSVTISAPTLSQFIQIERMIIESNLELGRKVVGLFASADLHYAYKAIFQCFLDCIESSTLGTIDANILKQSISVLDMPKIAWAMACAKYPNGYFAQIPCTANMGECKHVEMTIVDPNKMLREDNTKITSKMREVAANTTSQVSVESLQEYQEEFRKHYNDTHFVKLQGDSPDIDIIIEFHNPSIEASFNAAENWFAAIEESADKAFKRPLLGKSRLLYLLEQKQASNALVYAHFVNNITIRNNEDGEEAKIESIEEINSFLQELAQDDYIYNNFMMGVQRFINQATVTLIGLPNIPCPNCGKYHETDDPEGSGRFIVPIDVVRFFTMLCRELTKPYRTDAEETVNSNQMRDSLNS